MWPCRARDNYNIFLMFLFLVLYIVCNKLSMALLFHDTDILFPPIKTYLKKSAEILTCHSSTATSHTDSVFSSPVIPERSAAAEEKPDRRPVVAFEAFQSSSAALPLPSEHTETPL